MWGLWEGWAHNKHNAKQGIFSKLYKSKNIIKQAGAELCQAQAQLGYNAETTTKKDLHLKSWKLFELYETVTKQV